MPPAQKSIYQPPAKWQPFTQKFYEDIIIDYLSTRLHNKNLKALVLFECEPEEASTFDTILERHTRSLIYHLDFSPKTTELSSELLLWTSASPREDQLNATQHYTVRLHYFRNSAACTKKEPPYPPAVKAAR